MVSALVPSYTTTWSYVCRVYVKTKEAMQKVQYSTGQNSFNYRHMNEPCHTETHNSLDVCTLKQHCGHKYFITKK